MYRYIFSSSMKKCERRKHLGCPNSDFGQVLYSLTNCTDLIVSQLSSQVVPTNGSNVHRQLRKLVLVNIMFPTCHVPMVLIIIIIIIIITYISPYRQNSLCMHGTTGSDGFVIKYRHSQFYKYVRHEFRKHKCSVYYRVRCNLLVTLFFIHATLINQDNRIFKFVF